MGVDDESPSAAGPGEFFAFAAEEATSPDTPTPGNVYKPTILLVDDDADFQRSLKLALGNFAFHDAPVRILAVGSAAAAAKLLAETGDVSVIILDVVMETDDAGLRLVRSVREILGNAEVRIVLVTGQPGMAPMSKTLSSLDISDYWLKTDLTIERLHGVLTSNLRTWEQIRALGQARKGLQTIVEASNCLTRARNLPDFSQRVMLELARLLGVEAEGLVCVMDDGGLRDPLSARVVGAAGGLAHTISRELRELDEGAIRDALVQALTLHGNVEDAASQVLFFEGPEHGPHAATYIATGRPLDGTERELLRVFASNINSGLINVSLNSRLDRIAYEDRLLSMPNANALVRALAPVLDQPVPRERALLFIELNQYSDSCLSLGMEQGDLMLQKMAARLRAVFPPPSMVARLHGDTFAILGHSAVLQQDRIDQLETLDLDNPAHPSFISVRAARLDLDKYSGSARSAMAVGALLLRRGQAYGNPEVPEYQPQVERDMNRRFTQSRELYRALHSNEISIELQPQIDLHTGRILGAEALARWTRQDGTRVPPNDFIPLAEANGLIIPLGNQVLHLACQALQRLATAGFPNISVAVNVSPLQLARRTFMQEITEIAAEYGVRPEMLELEITETAAMGDYEAIGKLLRRLRDAGFPIAIDDFGTGYSSLAHLRSMPITTLKVDRHFVQEIGVTPKPYLIADMIISLGRRLNMQVLAEGVESEQQAIWLREHECSQAQGFLYARPEPFDAFLRRLVAAPTNI
jgi:EAL domain-containing protein (putative c-di-GMP-specific phosphodiesterase class I)/PleD family two-component response regulator